MTTNYLKQISLKKIPFDFGVSIQSPRELWIEVEEYIDDHINTSGKTLTKEDYGIFAHLLSCVPDTNQSGVGFIAAAKVAYIVAFCFATLQFESDSDFLENGVGTTGTDRVCRWLRSDGYPYESYAISAMISLGHIANLNRKAPGVFSNKKTPPPLFVTSFNIVRTSCCFICGQKDAIRG